MRTLIALSLLSLFSCSCVSQPEGYPCFYEYRETAMSRFPTVWYRVEATPGAIRILVSHEDGKVLIVRAPADIFQQIDKEVKKAHLERLKSRYKPLLRVLDGTTWSIDIHYHDRHVSSHGHQAWPDKKRREGIDAINALLQDLANNARGDDILGEGEYDDFSE